MINLNEYLNLLIHNPVVDQVGSLLSISGILRPRSNETSATTIVMKPIPLGQLASEAGPFVRIAGLLGASAVIVGAYGAHKQYPADSKIDLKRIYETANRFHFIHTLALLACPLAKRPYICGSFFIIGMTLFCGTCYYHAFTEDKTFQRLTPIGGTCLILGWLAMML